MSAPRADAKDKRDVGVVSDAKEVPVPVALGEKDLEKQSDAVPAGAPSEDKVDENAGPLQSEACIGLRDSVTPSARILLRLVSLVCAAVGFGIIVSTGTRTATVGDVRVAGRDYKKFRTLGYVVASNAILFVYSVFMMFWGTLVKTNTYKTSQVSSVVLSYIVQVGDLTISALQFGAATAVAGLVGALHDLDVPGLNYCGKNATFCRKLTTSAVFSYLAWAFMLPCMIVNIAGNPRGPW